MTGRSYALFFAMLVLTLVITGTVQRSAGWLPGAATLVAISIVNGLIIRYVNNRDLDRYSGE